MGYNWWLLRFSCMCFCSSVFFVHFLTRTKGGKLYLVACIPGEGQRFYQGELARGPPFDDRCAALGTWCGGACSDILVPPHCEAASHFIDFQEAPHENRTTPVGTYTFSSRSYGPMTNLFIFFSVLSFITFLLNHCAPVAAWCETVGKRDGDELRSQYPHFKDIAYKPEEICVAVTSVFCYERAFHILRNVIGLYKLTVKSFFLIS